MNTADLADLPLQSLIWPDPALCTERDLYVRLTEGAGMSFSDRQIQFAPGGRADFGTYVNLFNVGKWHKHCGLDQLKLDLSGAGKFELTVYYAVPDHSAVRLINEIVTLNDGAVAEFNIEPQHGFQNRGVVYFELCALSEAVFTAADWRTGMAPKRMPDLMLSVTTFKREEAVRATVDRFEQFMSQTPLVDHLHLTVVDNGRSAEITPSRHVSPIANENFGGSGGFARGLLAAQDRGATHCLFMDDDAAAHMQALERTWVFLAYATDTNVAISGALTDAQSRWRMWENGAVFDKLCHPQFIGCDLRDVDEVVDMELASTADKPPNFYGGWWYFAFPVEHVKYAPFPFFVRGDDISFSLMNDFTIINLPGVVCFQDENFSAKESPQTLYLDLRGHLAHHLVTPGLEIGRKGLMKIAAWFFLRSFLCCHYETLSAVNLSLRDAINGPKFFAENADMSERRMDIKALLDHEIWRPVEGHPPAEKRRFDPENFFHRVVMKATLNGHLLPFFSRYGNRITLSADQRGLRRPIWGASQISYLSADEKQVYTVYHNKPRAWREAWAYLKAAGQLWRNYDAIRADWRAGYDRLTTRDFWEKTLKMDPSDRPDP